MDGYQVRAPLLIAKEFANLCLASYLILHVRLVCGLLVNTPKPFTTAYLCYVENNKYNLHG